MVRKYGSKTSGLKASDTETNTTGWVQANEMKFRVVLLLLIVSELTIILYFLFREGMDYTGLDVVSRYTRVFSLALFSPIFVLQSRRETLSRWFSDRYYLVYAIAFTIHVATIVLLPPFLPYFHQALYIFCLAITLAMPAFQVSEDEKIARTVFPVAEKIFAYVVWSLFFITYYQKVENTFRSRVFVENVVLLAWVSTLMGYRISRAMRYRRPSR